MPFLQLILRLSPLKSRKSTRCPYRAWFPNAKLA
jgi:hypothetical protein